MAGFVLMEYPNGSRGTRITERASGQVDFGTCVKFDGSGDVQECTAATDIMIGVALIDERYEDENEDTYYASGNPLVVALRGAGEVFNLVNSGGVTEGDLLECAAGGAVATHTGGTNDYETIGIALETKTDGQRGACLIL